VKVVFGLERFGENENPEIQVHILPRCPHVTKPTHTHPHTLQNKLKQPLYKLKQPQYKIHPNESHNIIKYPHYKVILMYMALLSTRTSLHLKIKSLHINHVLDNVGIVRRLQRKKPFELV
jgi:hypothetical protein